MQLSNLSFIPDREFSVLGVVKGNIVVKAEGAKIRVPVSVSGLFKRDRTEYLNAVMDSVVTGKPQAKAKKESAGDAETFKAARQAATDIIIKEAEALSADAIINIKYETTSLTEGAFELLVYGTAVKLK